MTVLRVRASDGNCQHHVSDWACLVVLASLSAEPETLAELDDAICRFLPTPFLLFPAALNSEPDSAEPWCEVDLTGRTLVAGNGFEFPKERAVYEPDEAEDVEGFPRVWIDIPPDWLCLEEREGWRAEMAQRAAARMAVPRLDVRAVLFGQPLLKHLANGVLKARSSGVILNDEARLDRTRAIHAEWLMTPRPDLGGRMPRELLLADVSRIGWDMQNRCYQWTFQKEPARPLPTWSATYRLGGFGITEVVLYFDMIRDLLDYSWDTTELESRSESQLLQLLAQFRDFWLCQAESGVGHHITRLELIESERRRLPVTGTHMVDDDCPLCQAMADDEQFGPTFFHFDGSNLELEDEFAFSTCVTREEWEAQQEEFRRDSENYARKERERAERGETEDSETGSVWKSSFVNWDAPGISPWILLSVPLSEIVAALEDQPDRKEMVAELNTAFARLRLAQDDAIRISAGAHLCEVLETVCAQHPDLTDRCADLQSRIDEVIRSLELPF